MINTTFYKTSDDVITGFSVAGHAGYAESGKDIICAAVSCLTINTINSVECFTDNKFKTDINEDGVIKFKFIGQPDSDGSLLVKAFELGILGIVKDYGKKFVNVHYKEV